MKELFLAITAQLKTVAALNWIDDDYGQMEAYEMAPDIAFPGALVNLSYPQTEDTSDHADLSQLVYANVQVRLCFEPKGETNAAAPDAVRQEALDRFDVVQAVHEALQGFDHNGSIMGLSRVSQVPEARRDNYKVIKLIYKTDFLEVN